MEASTLYAWAAASSLSPCGYSSRRGLMGFSCLLLGSAFFSIFRSLSMSPSPMSSTSADALVLRRFPAAGAPAGGAGCGGGAGTMPMVGANMGFIMGFMGMKDGTADSWLMACISLNRFMRATAMSNSERTGSASCAAIFSARAFSCSRFFSCRRASSFIIRSSSAWIAASSSTAAANARASPSALSCSFSRVAISRISRICSRSMSSIPSS
mmetsp:Transcript_85764/g.142789  ORF Transcript_85764/g.142789 Transcript_85764/m.142789 type:complete len:212 (+) Transcript_85764:2277-2912(+)